MGLLQILKIAWRNLWRQKRRTLLTLLSIAFGSFLAILATAMQDRSFSDFIDTAARLQSGHVTIQHPQYLDTPTLSKTVKNTEELRKTALLDKDVSYAVGRIKGQIMLSTSSDNFGALLMAYSPEMENDKTFTFGKALIKGEMYKTSDDKGIILGKKLAQNLNADIGDKVVYTMMDKSGEIVSGLGRLSGIIKTGVPSLDAGLCLLSINKVRELLGYSKDESTYVAVFLSDSRKSKNVASRLKEKVTPDAVALTWDEVSPELASLIAIKIGGGRVMEIIIGILVAAGIFNTLFVSVMERLREFGIMMAIGHSPSELFALIIAESFWLGTVGILSGALITIGPYLYLSRNGIDLSSSYSSGGAPIEISGVGFDPILRIGIFPENLAIIVMAVIIATIAAGLYPAWRAGRVVPVDSIKLV